MEKRAPAAPSNTKNRLAADPDGLRLARTWLSDPSTPRWAHKHTDLGWARVLAKPAKYGWCSRDLNQALRDWQGLGHYLPSQPHRPIGLVGRVLRTLDLNDRPAAADIAREAEAAEQRRQRAHCPHCDEHGWRTPPQNYTGPDLAVRCNHTEEQNAVWMQLQRSELPPQLEGDA
ncbi:hypothetical protein ONR57_08815 [Hoyosella sp. YIM 151337]|uniref:hypothetical protein n=1 Tax=Hoyosella sp. YIM 151337 TaxID=2992742 RepID=UPI00223641E0|nr:hypothetical protein [Hoyosella sp. YIM 151337]MCW4353397.1 hypothetical protein [Hoyosella sp. YIM 151337]